MLYVSFGINNMCRTGPDGYNYTFATIDSWKNKYYTLFTNVYVPLSARSD